MDKVKEFTLGLFWYWLVGFSVIKVELLNYINLSEKTEETVELNIDILLSIIKYKLNNTMYWEVARFNLNTNP